MVTLIVGKKGSGKTKRLIDLCNAATDKSNGSVVFVEKNGSLTFNLSHKTRLVAADDYRIGGFDALYGFLSGMCAANYDVTDIFVDSTLKIGGTDLEQFADFAERLHALCAQANLSVVLSVSADKADLPARVAAVATQL